MALEPGFRSMSAGEKGEGNTDLPNRLTLFLLVLWRAVPPKTASKRQLEKIPQRIQGKKKETRNAAYSYRN